MLRLASDADVDGDIVRGLLRASPGLDLVRVQDAGLREAPDPAILEWAASEGRVLITSDRNTMVGFAYERVKAGQSMPGLLALRRNVSIGQAIEDILLIEQCHDEGELADQVVYIPLSP
jgi:predicted nuclease of predicted toxin-antitoxin system